MIYTKILTIITAAAFLTGCQSFGDSFKVDNRVMSTVVYWQTTDKVEETCNRILGMTDKNHSYLHFVNGCAAFMSDYSSCVIITGHNTTEAIVGHELRHCFQGKFHY